MKAIVFLLVISCLLAVACASSPARPTPAETDAARTDNPLLAEFGTPFGVPPFDRIRTGHFPAAFTEAMRQHRLEIAAIADNPEPPTFANTVEALDYSGTLLRRVHSVFFNLHAAHTNDEMQRVAKRTAPALSAHRDEIRMNAKLFSRIQAVYQRRAELELTPEQRMLIERTHRDFVRGGAELDAAKKAELKRINQRLSVLTLQFGENILKENNAFRLVIDKQADLSGLPQSVRSAAAEAAVKAGLAGKWLFTLHKPSLIPFLQYADKRELRERMFLAYIQRGDNDDERDNKKILTEIAALRVERTHLLGYPTHAHYVLEDNMAKRPEQVYQLLGQLWRAALPVTQREAEQLQAMIRKEGQDFALEPWDWWYYAEKLRQSKYALSEEALRPYFPLESVQRGVFEVATRLFGLRFVDRADLPVYHEEVRAVEVQEADGSHVGILYLDYHPRPGKRGGAWMDSYRKQQRRGGEFVTPVVCNVFNFSRPTGDKPALLSFEEVTTLFHEFGHALHGLLSQATYPRLSGTAVARDFVELPSQIMENWAAEPSVLLMYAKHHRTGEPIPQELIAKIQKSRHFNQGFATTEYLAASYLDMDWHTLSETPQLDVRRFEKRSMDRIGLIPEIVSRYRSTHFNHIFAGSYSSGYYSYIWAAVLDADAFQAFKEKKDLFDPETAAAFRRFILSKGGTEEPMDLYKRFRGAEPEIDALLERRGLKPPKSNRPGS